MDSKIPGRVRRIAVALALFGGMSVPAGVYAQTLYTGTPVPNVGVVDPGDPAVLGVQGSRSPAGQVLSAQGSRPAAVQSSRGALALTGGDVGGLVALGLSALGAGLFLTRRARRTTTG